MEIPPTHRKALASGTIVTTPVQGKTYRCVVLFFIIMMVCGFGATLLAIGYKGVRFYQGDSLSCDFGMRWSEVHALYQGIDPYDIWTCQIIHPYLFPLDAYKNNWKRIDFFINKDNYNKIVEDNFVLDEHGNHWKSPNDVYYPMVYAYPPNAYTLFLPLGKLTLLTGVRIFYFISLLAYGAALYFFFRRIKKQHPLTTRKQTFLLMVCAAGFAPCAWFFQLSNGNYGAIHLLSFLLILLSLDRSEQYNGKPKDRLKCLLWQGCGGVAFAIMLIKPQMGLLFGIPLLLSRKWVVISVAGIMSVAMCIPPALMCGKSPLELLGHLSNTGIPLYSGTAFIPRNIQNMFWQAGLGRLGIAISAIAGIMTCFFLSWLTRKENDNLVKLLPAIMLAPIWTYALNYDGLVFLPLIFYFSLRFLTHKPDWKIAMFCVGLAMVVVNLAWENTLNDFLAKVCMPCLNISIKSFLEKIPFLMGQTVDFFKTALLISFIYWVFRHYKPSQSLIHV